MIHWTRKSEKRVYDVVELLEKGYTTKKIWKVRVAQITLGAHNSGRVIVSFKESRGQARPTDLTEEDVRKIRPGRLGSVKIPTEEEARHALKL